MKKRNKYLYWTPRILGILYILFISLFALDVFEEYTFPEVLLALFMHLIPSFILLVILLVAWKWEIMGGILYLLLGLFYIWIFWGKSDIIAMLIILTPLLITAVLFIIEGIRKK